MLTRWWPSCVQAEAPVCYAHFALAHCKNLVAISADFSFQMCSKREWKQSRILQLQLSQYFLHLLNALAYWDCLGKKQSRHFLCAGHLDLGSELQDQLFWQAKRNIFSSTVSKPNQQDMTSLRVLCENQLFPSAGGERVHFCFGTWNDWISATSPF